MRSIKREKKKLQEEHQGDQKERVERESKILEVSIY